MAIKKLGKIDLDASVFACKLKSKMNLISSVDLSLLQASSLAVKLRET